MSLQLKSALSSRSDFTVAIAAVYRSTRAGFKRYLGVFAALGTRCGEHLAPWTITRAAIATLGLSGLATRWAALGLIGIAFGLEKLLILSAEGKGSPTIGTLDRLVLKTHWITSSIRNFS